MKILSFVLVLTLVFLAAGCAKQSGEKDQLPIMGNKYTERREVDGAAVIDTVYHKIAPFKLVNQEGDTITNEAVKGKVYVADFFFTSCPTICPVMKKEMLRVYEKFRDVPDFKILSHTIDPEYDSVALLKDYALKLGVNDASTWNFLTGEQEHIFEIGQTSYLATAMEDQNEPGGFLHSGAFVLIDQNGRIRGIYDGTKSTQVDRLMNDIPKLLKKDENKVL